MGDIFDVEALFPELVLGLGLALILGNGFAWLKNRRGETPRGLEEAQFRGSRALFLAAVGLVMSTWALASLINR